MKPASIVALAFVLLLIVPITTQSPNNIIPQQSPFVVADSGLLPTHDYVWQEINGFCAWAATAMAMQYAGVDLTMYDVFAASTIGFSFAYFNFDKIPIMYPGALYTQAEPTQFLADLYGINYTLYLGDTTPDLDQYVQVWESQGIEVGVLSGQSEALSLMRHTIDQGYPLLISVDPIYLPAYDYDYLRRGELSGGGHGVLIVGYNDTEASVTIIDPGVGSFGEFYGYPDDGRGNYTTILYTALIDAWSNRYYISNTFIPETPPVDPMIIYNPIDNRLGPMIRDKLLGVGTIYSPSSPNAYVGYFGQAAFRQMSKDVTADGLKSNLKAFDGIDNETEFKTSLLYFIGASLEVQVTLQYLSYRSALESLPSLMPDTNLTDFLVVAEDALPALDSIADNSSSIFLGNLSQSTGFVANTFLEIAKAYNASGDIDTTLAPYESFLDALSTNLTIIADSWRAAGRALAVYWPNDFFSVYGVALVSVGGAGAILVIGVVLWMRRRPSQ